MCMGCKDLLDHLIGEREQVVGDFDAQRPGGLGIDDQLELARLHHRQVRGLGPLEDATGLDADLTKHLRQTRSVGDQAAGFRKLAHVIDGG
jgi:hypothetical protein